ncbi:hypothetical protein [Fibrobacter sp. UBA4309]|uniref:hypothetical protein n=1 Tax=Fibrobacter sp. UBA4309 TaxID=1946537 RepID=UPI0025B8AAAD|nr:hypothetical protein [Fibrobacter sp. UBA4309]
MRIFSRVLSSALAVCTAFTLSACSGDSGDDGIAGTDGRDGVSGIDGKDGASGKDGKDGKDGRDGKDAAEVNVDSLAQVLRDEITGTLWDSLYAEPYVDTVYKILFDNAYSAAWMDSTRQALLDSLKLADYDSLYQKLVDSVYNDIYYQNAIRTMDAFIWTYKEQIYGAFANQYPLMYKDYLGTDGKPFPMPLSVKVRNTCDKNNSNVPCRWKKVMLKTWITGFTDTATVTGIANPDTSVILAPSYKFNNAALLAVTSPIATQFQVRVYALENDREILFYSASQPTTVHPMQVNGGELVGLKNRELWKTVWVTPAMDSIDNILNDLKQKLPGGTVKVYQQYSADTSIAQSSRRVGKAVFEILQARGIAYVQNNGVGSPSQKVNYPIEVLRSRDGLCIETTHLFASIFEALGMQPIIIEIPGHAFVGWRQDLNSNIIDFLETTMIANKNATFSEALNKGNRTFDAEKAAGNFDTGVSSFVDVEQTRIYGVRPNNIP